MLCYFDVTELCCHAYLQISVHQPVTLMVPVIDYFVMYNEYGACKEEEEEEMQVFIILFCVSELLYLCRTFLSV